jgi:uncharacterized membrane protein
LIPITTEEEFINAWNDMGSNGVEIEHVSLYFHSNPHNLIIDYTTADGEYITTFSSGRTQGDNGSNATWVGSLDLKEIGTLVFYTCNSGHLDHLDDNLAVTFLSYNTISNVYAWDGSMRWTFFAGNLTLANSQHYFESWITGDSRKPKGFIRFYVEDGNIMYDPVKKMGMGWLLGPRWKYVK